MNRLAIVFLISISLLAFSCKGKKGLNATKQNHLNELYGLMQGSFDSSQQAAEDEAFYDITLHMYPIWKDREDAKYLYVEQSVTKSQERPYRQRVYKLFQNASGDYVSEVYKLPNEKNWIMAWKDSRKWDALKPEQLEIREGCEVVMKRLGEHHFKGATGATSCGSTLRGASYATSKVEVTKGKIESWDQGFDKDGKQVWGAEKKGYVFLKKE